MRISDWSSDVCSSDLFPQRSGHPHTFGLFALGLRRPLHRFGRLALLRSALRMLGELDRQAQLRAFFLEPLESVSVIGDECDVIVPRVIGQCLRDVIEADALTRWRSEEHTSELQSLIRTSYAVFCLKKKTK